MPFSPRDAPMLLGDSGLSPWATASITWSPWCKKPQIPMNNPRTDAFWDFPPKRGFTGVSIGTWGERNSECKFCFRLDLGRVLVLLTHQIAQISLFYPQCCGRLVTLDTTFWKREDIPPNPFIYVLNHPLNLEKNHPILIPKGWDWMQSWGKGHREWDFPTGTEAGKNGFKTHRFSPRIERWPPRVTKMEGNSIMSLQDGFSLTLSTHVGKWWSFSPNKPQERVARQKRNQCILGFCNFIKDSL